MIYWNIIRENVFIFLVIVLMGLMNWIFGNTPKEEPKVDNTQETNIGAPVLKTEFLHIEIDKEITARMTTVSHEIWACLESKSKTGHILGQSHNSVMQSTISEMEFRGSGDNHEYECSVTFSDVEGDDNFTVKADMDHNLDTADDVYSVIIHKSSGFTILRGHPDENGVLHFDKVDHQDADRLLDYLERCMDIVAVVPNP